MNELSTVRLARKHSERVTATVCQTLPMTAGADVALWHDHLARISRIDTTSEAHHRRLAIPLVAAALITAAAHGWAGNAIGPQTSVRPTMPAQLTGVFTGQYVNGAPVYRLPSVAVIADRNSEPAKMKRQERLAHTKQAPSKFAARPPA